MLSSILVRSDSCKEELRPDMKIESVSILNNFYLDFLAIFANI